MRSKITLFKFNENLFPENFVSIAVKITEDTYIPFHAAILIRHQNINYLYHFPGKTPPELIEDFSESGWYIYKIIDSISIDDSYEVGSVLQHCRRVCAKSNITYSYIIDGSHYDNTGEFVPRNGLPEFGTCVGFCLNSLNNIIIDIEDSIIELDDWDDSNLDANYDAWSQSQALKKYPDLDWNLYNAFKKRVTPLEYLCTSYFNEYPIRKEKINQIKNNVLNEIKSLYNLN